MDQQKTDRKIGPVAEIFLWLLILLLLALCGWGLLTIIQVFSEAFAITMSGLPGNGGGGFYPYP
jgi:hypothetical protein